MIRHRKHTWLSMTLSVIVCAAVLSCVSVSSPLAAADTPICTSDPAFDPPSAGTGMITMLATRIQGILASISQDLFTTIEGDGSFQQAVAGVMTLYIAIYGLLFASGMAQATVYDFVIRMIKLALVSMLASGSAWSLFNQFVVPFFTVGTDELINAVTSVAVGPGGTPTNGPPLAVLDSAISKLLSANMIVHLIAILNTGVYGLAYAAMLVIAMYSFGWALLTGIWVYLMSLVLRTLLFGIAPIFLACMLFDRTKPLFLGWLNQVISACLQPILLFTFLSFFIVLVDATMDKVMQDPVCWTDLPDASRGTSFDNFFWRFMVNAPDEETQWNWFGPEVTSGAPSSSNPFPVDILTILIFFILGELSRQFSQIVLMIAKDLSIGGVDLGGMRGILHDVFAPAGGVSGASNIGGRTNPDGTRGVSAAALDQATNAAKGFTQTASRWISKRTTTR
jgi:type IV secretory pathway VirB6-like protein